MMHVFVIQTSTPAGLQDLSGGPFCDVGSDKNDFISVPEFRCPEVPLRAMQEFTMTNWVAVSRCSSSTMPGIGSVTLIVAGIVMVGRT